MVDNVTTQPWEGKNPEMGVAYGLTNKQPASLSKQVQLLGWEGAQGQQ
jgi:hypothetical protein